MLRAKQHFLNYHQCNLETGRQEEAKYFRYVIVWSMICELQVFNYCNSGKHWGFYCKVSLMKPFVVSTCRRRNGFNLSHGISLVLDIDQSERLIMAEQRVWYSRNFLWLREVGCKELNTCSLISYFSGTERWKSERLVWCFSMRVPGMWKQTPAWPVYSETKWKWCCLWSRGEGVGVERELSEEVPFSPSDLSKLKISLVPLWMKLKFCRLLTSVTPRHVDIFQICKVLHHDPT